MGFVPNIKIKYRMDCNILFFMIKKEGSYFFS